MTQRNASLILEIQLRVVGGEERLSSLSSLSGQLQQLAWSPSFPSHSPSPFSTKQLKKQAVLHINQVTFLPCLRSKLLIWPAGPT